MNDVQKAKVWTMVLLGLISMFLGVLPLRLGAYFTKGDRGWKNVVTSILLCFGGGVLFATAMIHMLPEVQENIKLAADAGIDFRGYPVAEILFCCGFFLIYLIEELVHFFLDKSVHEHHDETIRAHRAFSIHSQACEAGLSETQMQLQKLNPDDDDEGMKTKNILISANDYLNFSDAKTFSKNSSYAQTLSSEETGPCCNEEEEHSKSSLRDFFVVLALTFHAILEGIAVGLEPEVNDVWLLFSAVATHKYVMSFCVGLELYMAKTRLAIHLAYLFVFSAMSPIGIGIGLAVIENITHETSSYYLSVAVLQALASGTILYVVVFEILERERSKSISGLVQLCFVIFGFAVLLTVELLAGHSHGGDHHHHNHGNEHFEMFHIPVGHGHEHHHEEEDHHDHHGIEHLHEGGHHDHGIEHFKMP